MALGYTQPLYILAFDHRGSFQKKMLGIPGTPNDEERVRISDAKRRIFEGFQEAIAQGAPRAHAGLLVDEEFGADIARQAKADGLTFAMPVEKSGQDEFDFEYGEDFGAHILELDPTFSKVLVRYNPEGDAEMNERQSGRLRRLSDWLHEHDRKFLFELLVAAESHQLEAAGGDVGRFDREIRPGLMVRAIDELQRAGIEPDIWKIEGLDRREDCESVSAQVRSGGPRPGGLRGARARGGRGGGDPLAPAGGRGGRVHRVRHRPDDLVGRAEGVPRRRGRPAGDGEDHRRELPEDDRGVQLGDRLGVTLRRAPFGRGRKFGLFRAIARCARRLPSLA